MNPSSHWDSHVIVGSVCQFAQFAQSRMFGDANEVMKMVLMTATVFSSVNATDFEDRRGGLISSSTFRMIYYFVLPIRAGLCVLGTVTNVLCIRTFFRIGVVEGVTAVLFVQAVLDFCHVVPSFFMPVMWYFSLYESTLRLGVNSFSITMIMSIFARIFVESSSIVTSFLGVQRFLCVAMPLQFKGLFTRRRTLMILASIFVVVAAFHLALLFQHKFIKVTIPSQNLTQYFAVFTEDRELVTNIMLFVFAMGINISTQVIVTFCVLYMGIALTRSVRFRLGTSSAAPGGKQEETSSKKGRDDPASDKKESELTASVLRDTKELKIIKQVALVCTIYFICNTPRVITAIVEMAVTEFNVAKRYTFMARLAYAIQAMFEHLNTALNFFVYYSFNDSFRKACFRKKEKILN